MEYPSSPYENFLLPVDQTTASLSRVDVSSADNSGVSVMLTGAPATGKTTVMRELTRNHNFVPHPDITTRAIRSDEVNGIDKRFVTVEEFIRLHEGHRLIEESLRLCTYQGSYYGSPVEWLDSERLGRLKVLTCVALRTAGVVRRRNKDVLWVHLESGGVDRAERLALRGLSQAAIAKRLNNDGGDAHLRPVEADMLIDTSQLDLPQTIDQILEAS